MVKPCDRKRKRHHGKRCKCKKCVVKYREIRIVKTKTTKQNAYHQSSTLTITFYHSYILF